jgi:outer membrane protein OmpA-like peptidoglycan-associated protein
MRKVAIKLLKLLLIFLVIYAFVGFVILPYLVQSNFSKIIRQQTSANATLGKVYLNPFTFELIIKDLLLHDNENKTLVYFKKFYINVDITTLLKDTIIVQDIYLENFKSNIVIKDDKKTNFQYILSYLKKYHTSINIKQDDKKIHFPAIKFNNIRFKSNRISFMDNSKNTPFKVTTKKFNINLHNISTKLNSKGIFYTNIDIKNTLKLAVKSTVTLNPFKIIGILKIKNFKINKIFSYIKDNVNFKVVGDSIDLLSNYQISILNGILKISFDNLNTEISNIKYKNNKFYIDVKNFKSKINDLLICKDISSNDINLTINTIQSSIKKVIFKDKKHLSTAHNIKNSIDAISFNLSKPIKTKLYLETQAKGFFLTNLIIIPKPFSINGSLIASKVALMPYSQYVKQIANIDIKSGLLSTKLKISNKKSKIQVKGDIFIDNILLFHSLTNKKLFAFKKLSTKNLNFINKNLTIKNIILDQLSVNLKIAKDKITNFDDIMINTNKNLKKIPNTKQVSFNYFINQFKLKNSKIHFIDLSLPLPFNTNIHTLNANINALSSKDITTKVKLIGKVDKYGMANIEGTINPINFKKNSNISINFENLDLISASPYSGKFLGQKILKGKLWLVLNYNIKDSNLTSANNIRIKNLTLGDKVDSNESMSLPIDLAIALLEDSDGFIDVNVPVSGDINNPEFHLSSAIWSAVGNVIKNIITAPFRFLASLLGISSDKLGNIDFDFGSSTILPPQMEILDQLVNALKKKPKLSLQINPIYDIKKDRIFLQKKKFLNLINKKNKSIIIKQMYLEKFGKIQYNNIVKKFKSKNINNELSKALIPSINIIKKRLISLATNRAKNVKLYLILQKLSKNRILISKNILVFNKLDTKKINMKLDIKIKE